MGRSQYGTLLQRTKPSKLLVFAEQSVLVMDRLVSQEGHVSSFFN